MESLIFWILWVVILILIVTLFIILQKNNKLVTKFKWHYKKWVNGGGLMTKKNCNNCKFEPDWGEWIGDQYPRCSGKCKYSVMIPALPSVYRVQHSMVTKYSDGSGTMENCPTWTRRIKRRKLWLCDDRKLPCVDGTIQTQKTMAVEVLGKMIDKVANANGREGIIK